MLVGWTAVTDHLAWPAIVLFAMIVIWTPSHFWALALRYQEDYEAANVPMLPAVVPFERVARQILLYSVALVATSLVFGVVDHSGWIYWAAAVPAGGLYLADALRLRRENGTPKSAMRLFTYSITYITVVFVAMAVDVHRPLPLRRRRRARQHAAHSHLKVSGRDHRRRDRPDSEHDPALGRAGPGPSVGCRASERAAVGSRRAKDARPPSSCSGKMTPPMSSRIT